MKLKSRMEPLGIIVFAAVITTSFSQVLISSVEQLAEENRNVEHVDLSPLAVGLLGANIVVKGVLWFWCSTVKGSSSVQALAQDHENDVVFNIASTIFPLFGEFFLAFCWLFFFAYFICHHVSCMGKDAVVRSRRCYFTFVVYYL